MASVKEIMLRPVVAVNVNASAGTAKKLMDTARVSVLPVLSGSRLVGIVTRSELEVEPQAERLGAMKLRLVYVTEDDSIDKAARLMVENSIARIPVVKDNVTLHCTGIVSATEIAKYHKEK
ncbi:MAG: CBS domain-containing protein [Candidatus Micrarchaeia archaeon]